MRVIRRKGAVSGIDLRKIRRWFADDKGADDKPADDKGADDKSADDKKGDDDSNLEGLIAKDPKKAAAEIRDLRAKEAANRIKLRDLEKAQRAADAQKKAADDKKLLDDKNFEGLAAKAKAEADEARDQLLLERRKRIAIEHKLPKELADRLKGTTEEEMTADAQELAKLIKVDEGDKGKKPGNTTKNPDGRSVGETHEQKRNRIYGRGNMNIFGGKK